MQNYSIQKRTMLQDFLALSVEDMCTPDRQQSKTLFTIDEHGSKIIRNSVFDCHFSPAKKFLTIFYLCSSKVFMFLIAAYPA